MEAWIPYIICQARTCNSIPCMKYKSNILKVFTWEWRHYTHIFFLCVCVRERNWAQSLSCVGGNILPVCLMSVCMSATVNVGQCILLCVCMTWAQYAASLSPQDSVGVCVCVFMCVNVLCVFHLSLVSSYLSLCVCFAPVNQSSPFTFPLGW